MEKLPLQDKFNKWDGKEDIQKYLFKMMIWIEKMYARLARFGNSNIISLQPSIVTQRIHLPTWLMFQTGATNLTASPPTFSNFPTILISNALGAAAVGYPKIYYNAAWDPTAGWLATHYTNVPETSVWHTIFQIPGDYVANTDLVVTFNEQCVVEVGGAAAEVTVHQIDMYARRDTNANGKGVWGYNDGTWAAPGNFNWNTDICLTAAQNTTIDLAWQQLMANTVSFIIDGDATGYPLTPGRFILLNFESKTDYVHVPPHVDKDCRNIFANFFVTYDAYRVMPTE